MRATLRRFTLAFASFILKDPRLPAALSSAQETDSSSPSSVQKPLPAMTSDLHSKLGKFASKHGDALFGFIERAHIDSVESSEDECGAASFGSFLDAGARSTYIATRRQDIDLVVHFPLVDLLG